ncbi:uncharacterized protein LOC126855466 [Cataglyphis hispanica]|uniref:uncharacterized protein LOC126855466 n=1 Tax=Cataglyphis hispanica TaxID=1086592 RepID=UPI00217F9155|nr:uncharacterized protein LOC126855466 [Cataglyphis hispanica]
MYNTESRRFLGKKKPTEKSVEDFHSNSDTQTIVSQRHPNVVECESLLTSINKHENNHPAASTVEKTEGKQTEKYVNNKTESNINHTIQNHSKEDDISICNEKTPQVLQEATKSIETKKTLKKSKRKKRTFSLLDALISVSIIGPLAISVWRGVWTWMDLHSQLFPGWFCFTFGTALHVTFAIFKDRFHDIYTNKWAELNWRKRLFYRALRILYTYTFGVACITHWRGGWIIIDNYLFTYVWITMALMCSLLVCLAVLRCIRNLLATPFIIFVDIPSYVFQFPTRYKVVIIHLNNCTLIIAKELYDYV